jgi:hypothetical protein
LVVIHDRYRIPWHRESVEERAEPIAISAVEYRWLWEKVEKYSMDTIGVIGDDVTVFCIEVLYLYTPVP